MCFIVGIFWFGVLVLISVLVLVLLMFIVVGVVLLFSEVQCDFLFLEVSLLDCNGELLQCMCVNMDECKLFWVKLEDVFLVLWYVLVVFEDWCFYQYSGIDWSVVVVLVWGNLWNMKICGVFIIMM